jgi:hypothetical protein
MADGHGFLPDVDGEEANKLDANISVQMMQLYACTQRRRHTHKHVIEAREARRHMSRRVTQACTPSRGPTRTAPARAP